MSLSLPSEVALEECCEVNLAAPKDDEKPGPRHFDMLAYSGGEVLLQGTRAVFDLSGMELPKHEVPIFRQHDPKLVVGVAEKIDLSATELRIQGRMFATGPAQEVQSLSAEGLRWQASMGVRIRDVDFLAKGESRSVNEREFSGPGVVVTSSFLRESSFVPLGADSSTRAAVLDGSQIMEFDMGTSSAPSTTPDPVQAERQRVKELRGAYQNKDADFAFDVIDRGCTLSEAKALWADKLEAKMAEAEKAHEAKLAEALASHEAKLEEAKKAAKPSRGVPASVGSTGSVGEFADLAGETASEKYTAALNKFRFEQNLSSDAATARVERVYPGLRVAYLAEVNGVSVEAVGAYTGKRG